MYNNASLEVFPFIVTQITAKVLLVSLKKLAGSTKQKIKQFWRLSGNTNYDEQ